MREIKYRAWDTENKEFIYEAQATYDNACTGLGSLHHESFQEVLEDNSLIVEQYTGLKDQNGKEVYEGDILLDGVGEPCEPWVVKFEDGKFIGEIQGVTEDLFELTDLEIIGNIHENPELLEAKNVD